VTASVRTEGTLRAPRIRQHVLLARDHPEPERVRGQLHAALSRHLGDALAAAFPAALSAQDDSVWRIRKLTVNVAVNTTWEAALLARVFAAQLVRAVKHSMQSGGDGVSVMRWANSAAYLANFLQEVAAGTATSRWWFDSFGGLRLLERSAQIRTVLARNPTLGAAALMAMPSTELTIVVSQLSTADARWILEALFMGAAVDDVDGVAFALLNAYQILGAPQSRAREDHWVLRVAVESLRKRPLGATRAIGTLARAIARWSHISAEQPGRTVIICRLLASGNAAGLRLVLGGADAEALAPLASASAKTLQAIADRITDTPSTDVKVADTTLEVVGMPVAAPLLLAPFAAALPLGEATRDWPAIGADGEPAARSASAASLVRLFILAAACGGERAARVVHDPTTRRLAGVGSAVSIGQVRDWLDRLTPNHAERLEQTVREWRLTSGGCDQLAWLLAEVAHDDEDRRSPRMVLTDCARGHWLSLCDRDEAGRDGGHTPQRWLYATLATHPPRELLVNSTDLARIARESVPAAVKLCTATDRILEPRTDELVLAALQRCDRLPHELDWLTLPASLGVPRRLELGLTALAQGILRDLAWRIPGFSRASLPHLWANFLAIDAQLVQEPQRLIARLGRPPLAMVIGMTGLMRATYRLPWLEPMLVALFPTEGT
jgi:hypothetical protein